jgi:hypothetical protein
VKTGGLGAFFRQDYESVPHTAEALRAVGLDDMAEVLERAIDLFPNGWPSSKYEVDEALATLQDDRERAKEFDRLQQVVMIHSRHIEQATHVYIRITYKSSRRSSPRIGPLDWDPHSHKRCLHQCISNSRLPDGSSFYAPQPRCGREHRRCPSQ